MNNNQLHWINEKRSICAFIENKIIWFKNTVYDNFHKITKATLSLRHTHIEVLHWAFQE